MTSLFYKVMGISDRTIKIKEIQYFILIIILKNYLENIV